MIINLFSESVEKSAFNDVRGHIFLPLHLNFLDVRLPDVITQKTSVAELLCAVREIAKVLLVFVVNCFYMNVWR